MSKTFHGAPCPICSGTERYIKSRKRCVTCARRKANDRRLGADTALRFIWEHTRWRAARDGIEFTIKLEELVVPELCPVLGTPLGRPSLDRHDHTKGYVPGNVVVMSWRANNLKSDGHLEEFMTLVEYLRLNPVVA